MLIQHRKYLAITISLGLSVMLLAACRDNSTGNNGREAILCGTSSDDVTRVYHISISQSAATVVRVIDLPQGASCPKWLSNTKTGWLQVGPEGIYPQAVYWLDLGRGQLEKWFDLNADDEIEDVALVAGSPRALIISSRDQTDKCSQYTSPEGHWTCLYSWGDLYAADKQGSVSRLTYNQSPLCQARLRPGGHTVAFTQSKGCVGPAPFEGSQVILVDTTTKQVRPFNNNEGGDPTWSPDGRYLAFFRDNSPPLSFLGVRPYVLDFSNGRTFTPEGDFSHWEPNPFVWSPESNHLAWAASPDYVLQKEGAGLATVSVLDVECHVTMTMTAGTPGFVMPQWSPDGTGLAWRNGQAFYFGAISNSSVYSVPIGVTEVLDWSFDGKGIAWIGSDSPQGPNQVYVMGKDGKNVIDVMGALLLQDVHWRQVRWVKQ